MSITIKHKRGSSTQWETKNLVLADGEIGYERDTGKIKIGNGITPWLGLEYFVPGASSGGSTPGPWTPLPLEDGFELAGSGWYGNDATKTPHGRDAGMAAPEYRLNGDTVQFRGSVYNPLNEDSNVREGYQATLISILPEEARPTQKVVLVTSHFYMSNQYAAYDETDIEIIMSYGNWLVQNDPATIVALPDGTFARDNYTNNSDNLYYTLDGLQYIK
jgi:hypothetical protein